jgi:hypothetical protein
MFSIWGNNSATDYSKPKICKNGQQFFESCTEPKSVPASWYVSEFKLTPFGLSLKKKAIDKGFSLFQNELQQIQDAASDGLFDLNLTFDDKETLDKFYRFIKNLDDDIDVVLINVNEVMVFWGKDID